MKVEILSPKGLELETEADVVTVPTLSGEISVLPHHMPIVTVLKAGRMTIKRPGSDVIREIESGVLEKTAEKIVILLKIV